MQAETIELLSGKGSFSTEQALILAEAIDRVVEKAQFVTVPLLDMRIATVTARMDAMESKLIARIESGEARLEARISSVETRLEARISSVETTFGARVDSLEAKIDAKFERWTLRIVVMMILSQTALGPIGMRAFESMRQVISALGH